MIIFKNCASFTDCKGKINITKVDNAKDIDVVTPMYNLIEYKGISKSSSAAECTGHWRVKARVTLGLQQNFKVIISCRTH